MPNEPNLTTLYSAVFRRVWDATPETCFEGIFQLRPAHFFKLRRDSWRLDIRKYWSLPERAAAVFEMSRIDNVVEELRELLASSVKLRLRSDRSVGLLLSGGMDSSSIAGMIARNTASNGISQDNFSGFYSMALQGDTFDESCYAESVSKHLDIELRKMEVGDLPLTDLIPSSIWHNDEPLDSLNRCVHWHMMKTLASQGVIVILNGQGGG